MPGHFCTTKLTCSDYGWPLWNLYGALISMNCWLGWYQVYPEPLLVMIATFLLTSKFLASSSENQHPNIFCGTKKILFLEKNQFWLFLLFLATNFLIDFYFFADWPLFQKSDRSHLKNFLLRFRASDSHPTISDQTMLDETRAAVVAQW